MSRGFRFPYMRCLSSQADVHDHMEYILTSLDMFAGISENLINFTFNVCPLRSPFRVAWR